MKDEVVLTEILNDVENQMRANNLEGFKSSAKGLASDALRILEDARAEWKRDQGSKKLSEQFNLLSSYLDYLRRFCEGIS